MKIRAASSFARRAALLSISSSAARAKPLTARARSAAIAAAPRSIRRQATSRRRHRHLHELPWPPDIDSGGLVVTAGFAYQYFPRSVEADRSQTAAGGEVGARGGVRALQPHAATEQEGRVGRRPTRSQRRPTRSRRRTTRPARGRCVGERYAGERYAGAQSRLAPRVTHTRSADTDQTPASAAMAPPAPRRSAVRAWLRRGGCRPWPLQHQRKSGGK